MALIGQILGGIGGLGLLVCYILLIVQCFQRGATGMGIALALLWACCAMGFLIGLIFGWIKNKEWGITNLMIAYTVCFILVVIGNVLAPTDYSAYMKMPG